METDSDLLLYERLHKNVSFLLLSEQKAKIATSLLAHASLETKKNHESVRYCIYLKTVSICLTTKTKFNCCIKS